MKLPEINLLPQIIAESEDLLIINKPAGWLTHPSGRGESPAITSWVIARDPASATIGLPERLSSGEEISRAGILHRLDRETSGILAVAKDQNSFNWYSQMFKERRVKKVYQAIVSGVIKKDEGVIDQPIGRSHRDPRRRVASPKAAPPLREAVTRFKVLERFAHHTHLELYPETGRTHQLRVHLKFIQAPILGDSLYSTIENNVPTISRVALHALSLTLPRRSGEEETFLAPLPQDFINTLEYLRQEC